MIFTLVNHDPFAYLRRYTDLLVVSQAGDTGQSVSKDSLFRFSNSKALFNTHFKDVSSLTEKESESWKLFSPKLLPLPNNYRSHTGIQAIASILMDLLYTGMEIQYGHDSLITKLILFVSISGTGGQTTF